MLIEMARLSRDQKRKQKLAERQRRQADLTRKAAPCSLPVGGASGNLLGDVESGNLALVSKLCAVAPGPVFGEHPVYDALILDHGLQFDPTEIVVVEGQEQRCMENCTAYYWLHRPAVRVATGYAYHSIFRRWCRHGWLMDGKRLIETTFVRNFYFGVVLDDRRALDFMLNGLMSMVDDLAGEILPTR